MKAMKCLAFGIACICVAAAAQGAVSGYVQDGLIAHWDAIDNVGTGVHDPSATTWKDLTGLHPDMVFPNGTLIGDNYYDMAGVSGGTGGYVTNVADIATAIMNKACTVEIVCDFRSQVENGTVFSCYETTASKRILWVRSNNGGADANACGCFGSAEYLNTGSSSDTLYKLDNGHFNEPRIYTVRCNGDTANIYKNGTDTKLSIAAYSLSGVDVSKAWFCIGRRYASSSPSTGVADMKVYAVRIYNRVLSDDEILANAEADNSRFGLQIVFPKYLPGYARYGLIAHWDAIDNVGTGVHDASAATWTDLVGHHPDMVFPNGTLIGENYYDMTGVSGGTGGYVTNVADIATAIMNKACTVEIVCDFRSQVEDGTLFSCYESVATRRILWVRSNKGGQNVDANGCIGAAEYCWSGGNSNVFKIDNGCFNEPRIYAFKCNGNAAKIYRNGKDTSKSIPSGGLTSVDASKAWFCIGRRYAASSPSTPVADMKVYAVRIYDRVLSPAEILANAKTDDSRFGLHVVFPSPKSSRDYVQNGLIAQWDGVENAGRGARKDNARTWKDLVGSCDFIFPDGANVGATFFDMLHTNGTSAAGYATNIAAAATAIGINHCATVEVVCDFRSMAADGTLFGFLDANRRLLWVRSANNNLVQGCASVCEYMRTQWDTTVNLSLDIGVFNAVRTYDFCCFDNACAVSKNGTYVKSLSKGAVTIDAAGATNTWLSIGLGRSSSGTQANNADVKIHAIRIYNRQLSSEEIAANAEVDDWRFGSGQYVAPNKSGLLVYVR